MRRLIATAVPAVVAAAVLAIPAGGTSQGITVPSGYRVQMFAHGLAQPTAMAYGAALEPYDLFWYEEAGDPLDFDLQTQLGRHYSKPMATGENLFSMQDARNLIRYGGMRPDRDWLQFDCALSYGLVEYLRTLEMLKSYGWSWRRCIPHGGHQMSLNIAAGLGLGGNESYPDLFQPYGGFPDGVRVEAGHITMPSVRNEPLAKREPTSRKL